MMSYSLLKNHMNILMNGILAGFHWLEKELAPLKTHTQNSYSKLILNSMVDWASRDA